MECYWVLGQRIDFLATGDTTGGHYALFHVFIPMAARNRTVPDPGARPVT